MPSKEISALRRACLYSLPPNKLGYCGPCMGWVLFNSFIADHGAENMRKVGETLKKFFALYPYLELIAQANDLQPFDEEVVEAYWLGGKLLESVQYGELQKTILGFQVHGLPRAIAEKKAAQLPDGLLPHHSFHVLYINFITQKVEPIVENLGNCIVQWAAFKKETEKGLEAKGIELFSESGELKVREKTKILENPFSLRLKPGDNVSVHWGNTIEPLSAGQLRNLKKYTEITLSALHQ